MPVLLKWVTVAQNRDAGSVEVGYCSSKLGYCRSY